MPVIEIITIVFAAITIYLCYKGKLPPILSGSLLFIESTIPDTGFFQPAFPFSDYCLKRGKAQFVEYQPEES